MKKFGIVSLTAMMAATLMATAPAGAANLQIPDFEMYPGGSYDATLSVNPGSEQMFEYRGFQFDLTLKPGITVDFEKSSAQSTFSFYGENYADGNCRVVAFIADNAPTVTVTDNLMSIAFNASADIAPGDYTINISNVIFSTPLGQDRFLDDSSFVITILPEPDVPVTSLTVTPTELTMYVDDAAAQLTATVLPENATNKELRWTSSEPGIATVSQTGLVTPVAPGKSVVTVATTDGSNLTATCNVTVLEREPDVIPVMSIVVTPSELEMTVGDAPFMLTATVLPEDATNKTVFWSSSNEAIATVDQMGYVTPVMAGTCVVTATTTDGTNLSGTCNVTVLEREPDVIPVMSIVVTPSELEMTEGDDPFMLTAIVLPENATNKTVFWSSSNEAIATVDQMGYVTPVMAGTCVVTATTTDGTNLSGTCDVTVLKKEGPQPPEPEIPDTPQVPVTPIPDGTTGNNNGTFVMPDKIREGDELMLGINEPIFGYEDAYEFYWTDPASAMIGEEAIIGTPALLFGAAANSGVNQAISKNVYNVKVTNYGPENEIFWQATFPTAEVQVYKRPQIPTQLLRKGAGNPEVGTSHTFVVMMTPLDNQQILDLGYSYTYGYTDRNGNMHVLETTEKRYTHTTDEIYWNPDYTFWAYSQWTYADGSVVTSGLRYLDGSEDPEFNASVFAGTRGDTPGMTGVDGVNADDNTVIGIYTLDGRNVGTELNGLEHGIYIIRTINSAKKIKL